MKRAGRLKITLGLIAFVLTSMGLFISTIFHEGSEGKLVFIILLTISFVISLVEHYKEIIEIYKDKKVRKDQIKVLICAFLGVVTTWYLNHHLNLGSIVANGIIGIIAVFLLPKDLAGITYTSSFVGMSSLEVLPGLLEASLAGIVVGIILLLTGEIYAGIGGKGGTTAALSTQIARFISTLFN